jgi:hypothetical protein
VLKAQRWNASQLWSRRANILVKSKVSSWSLAPYRTNDPAEIRVISNGFSTCMIHKIDYVSIAKLSEEGLAFETKIKPHKISSFATFLRQKDNNACFAELLGWWERWKIKISR